jgi:hypothetical protein
VADGSALKRIAFPVRAKIAESLKERRCRLNECIGLLSTTEGGTIAFVSTQDMASAASSKKAAEAAVQWQILRN